MTWTSAELIEATNGLARRPFAANGVSIDSRTVRPGELFVALATDTGDGHDFVADALGRGAAGALIHRLPDGVGDDAPLLQVADTLDGLWALGRFARARFAGTVIGVTGSVGKTTTKEMLARMLAAFAPTWAAEASHNNQWGVPLTLARCPAGHGFCVCEIGTNHPGEIAPLARLARPGAALVTAVSDAHIGHFPNQEALRAEKLSIREGLEAPAVFVVPGVDADLAGLDGGVIRHGDEDTDAARLLDYQPHPDGCAFTADILGTLVTTRLAAPGRHMAEDAVAALALVAGLGLDVGRAAAALENFQPVTGRGAHRRLAWKGGEIRVIDESYNASPKAVRAALAVLREQDGRHVAVLGDMLELGTEAARLHAELAGDVETAADRLFTCGPLMRSLADAVPDWLHEAHAADADALAPLVVAALEAGDVVLVKGSLGSRMARVVRAIEGAAP
jgi:UDP-N-acetylmuramoyl-tripeptide--D-alanyl-D-alanine ligase